MPAWLQRLALISIVALIVGAFVLTGVGTIGPSSGVIANIRGEEIRREVYEYYRELNEDALRQFLTQLTSATQRNQLIDQQTRGSLIRRYTLGHEAADLGLEVPDDELQLDLWANPAFREDGRYSPELAELLAARSGLGMRGLADELRRDVEIRKLRRLVESPVRISEAQARWELTRDRTSVTLAWAAAETSEFEQGVVVGAAAVEELLATDPERVRARYDGQLDEFQHPEEVRARHILLEGEDAMSRAQDLRGRLVEGGDFEALAREHSSDEATREAGGDLGWFPRGLMVPGFDEVAFELTPGMVSEPLETERGVHLIRVEDRREARETPYEEVADGLALELLIEERADEQARQAAQQLLERTAAGEEFAQVAEEIGLPVTLTSPIHWSDRNVSGLETVSDLVALAFALTESAPLAPEVLSIPGRHVALRLHRVDLPEPDAIADDLTSSRERLTEAQRSQTSQWWYRVRLRELEESGEIVQYDLASG